MLFGDYQISLQENWLTATEKLAANKGKSVVKTICDRFGLSHNPWLQKKIMTNFQKQVQP